MSLECTPSYTPTSHDPNCYNSVCTHRVTVIMSKVENVDDYTVLITSSRQPKTLGLHPLVTTQCNPLPPTSCPPYHNRI